MDKKHARINTVLIAILSIAIFVLLMHIFDLHNRINQLETENIAHKELLRTILVEVNTLNTTIETGNSKLKPNDIKLVGQKLFIAENAINKLITEKGAK